MAGRFTVKGINDEQSFCSCCGKQNLKRVVWIEDTETGEINHFGEPGEGVRSNERNPEGRQGI
jgi:hypothetical protein